MVDNSGCVDILCSSSGIIQTTMRSTMIHWLWCTNYDDAPTISTNYAPTLFFTAPVPAPVMFPMKMVKSSAAMIFAELCADAEKRAEPSGCFRSKHFCNLSTEGCFRSKHLGYLSLRIVINPKYFFFISVRYVSSKVVCVYYTLCRQVRGLCLCFASTNAL